jgi:hypothetical protein
MMDMQAADEVVFIMIMDMQAAGGKSGIIITRMVRYNTRRKPIPR